MLKTYFLLAYRTLVANRVASTINIVGLSIAVAASITVFLILKNFWSLDEFHTKGEQIYMLEYTTERRGEVQTYGDAPAPMAAVLAQYPQVRQTVRVEREGVRVYHNDGVLDELLTYADTNFFALFDFPLRAGNAAVLRDPTAVILSHRMAEKYFPNQNAVGQSLALMMGDQAKKVFTVRGVAEPFPSNAGFMFNFLTSYNPIHTALRNPDWTTHLTAIFAQIDRPAEADKLTRQLARYVPQYNARNPDQPIRSFVFDNLRHPAPNAYDVRRRPAEANHPIIAAMFVAMALVMMALSCVNYVNISLGAVSQRLKEIGIRKVMGGTRTQLVAQFMTENLLLCLIALALGLLLTQTVLVPLFNSIMVVSLSLVEAQNASLWLFLSAILLFTAVASGAYPALYLSGLRPIVVFASRQGAGQRSVFSRVLLTVQFGLAFVSVILGVVVSHTGLAWRDLDWGYDPTPTLAVRLTDSTQYTILKNELARHPAVVAIAGSEHHVGESMAWQEIKLGADVANVVRYDVGADYFPTLGLTLASGQFFSPERTAENAQSVVVNETFVRRNGWRGPVRGKPVRIDQQLYTVLGVVSDFKLFGTGVARPAVFLAAQPQRFNYLVVRFTPGSGPGVVAALEKSWRANFAGTTCSHVYQTDVFDPFYTSFENVSRSFGYVAGLALLIACMGLYGLAAQHFARRLKEVSVRKVLGASVGQIMLLVNRRFIGLLTLAGVLANMGCYLGILLMLQQTQEFTGTYAPGLWPYVIANAIVLLTATLAVANQTWRTATVRLAESLRNND